jgi:uncharacterized protein YndB with AHSA1/START domain
MSIRQHDFTIERRFGQSPVQTFRAFADPELKQRWFGVPEGWAEASLEVVRVGSGAPPPPVRRMALTAN